MFAVFGALCAIYIICVRHGVADALFSGCAAAWFFRLRRFAAFPAHILAVGLFRPCFRLFRPLCCVLSLRADAAAACAVSAFLPSDISAEIVAAFFGSRLLPLQRAVFRAFQKAVFWLAKGGLLQPERIPFCTLKGHLLESGFSTPRASPHGSRRGRAEPCLGRGHPEGVIRGVRQSEILLLFIVRNIKFCLKVNLCPDFVSYYLSVGSNVFA